MLQNIFCMYEVKRYNFQWVISSGIWLQTLNDKGCAFLRKFWNNSPNGAVPYPANEYSNIEPRIAQTSRDKLFFWKIYCSGI